MSLFCGNYVNCLLIIGLSNNLTIVTQGVIPVKLHYLSIIISKLNYHIKLIELRSNEKCQHSS